MSHELKVLLLEDSEVDAELNCRALTKSGLNFVNKRVENEADFSEALRDFRPDIVLADYSLPSYDGLNALNMVRASHKHLPFIFVTGAMGEERAVESLRKGANDYILKDRLGRLGEAVKRVLSDVEKNREMDASKRAQV